MGKKIFVSYNHKQKEWVWNCLVPCLRAGGVEIIIDRERAEPGKNVIEQIDTQQDLAEISLLVLSPEYLASGYCRHEMERAIKRDPEFKNGLTIPVKLVDCSLPEDIKVPDALYVNLCNEKDTHQWDLLMRACEADLGTDVPHWLKIRDEILRFLRYNESVNLVVFGTPKWKELIQHIQQDFFNDLARIDLESGATVSRRGLVSVILERLNIPAHVPEKPGDDLVELDKILSTRSLSRLSLEHFHLAADREDYDINLFATFRHLIMDSRKLVLLIESRIPFGDLLPKDNLLSDLNIKTIELKGRK